MDIDDRRLEWIENLISQCSDAAVPVFVKQAEINGTVVSMPEIMGRVWDQLPGENPQNCPNITIGGKFAV